MGGGSPGTPTSTLRRYSTFFAFNTRYTNVDLRLLMADVANKTNQLEGRLNGALVVHHADTEDPRSWFGQGHLGLTNGMIWDIPIFGIFSPILNSVVPGLGNSRAKKASATFILTNSVLFSRDLQIHATAMRMQYDLAVVFDQRIAGRVEAELLRDMPGLGLVISRVLWPVTKLFEYRLSGSIDQPKAEPLFFIPRVLLLPVPPDQDLEGAVYRTGSPAARSVSRRWAVGLRGAHAPPRGRDAFHCVPDFSGEDGDAVERVPTGFMAPTRGWQHVAALHEPVPSKAPPLS